MDTLHNLFPVFDDDQALYVLHAPRQNRSPGQTFLLKMVYSLACHCLPVNDNRLVDLSGSLYRESLIYIDTLLKDHSIEAVQGILLLALRSSFDATTGNIGQLVNFSYRLLIELSSHSVLQMSQTMGRLQCTVYCLTGLVAGALDRPYDVAEPVSHTAFFISFTKLDN